MGFTYYELAVLPIHKHVSGVARVAQTKAAPTGAACSGGN
jgi:hypothetical protein